MKVLLSELAKQQIQNAIFYIRTHQHSNVATKVFTDIVRVIELAGQMPRIGRRQTALNVRRCISRRYKYLVYYEEAAGSEIHILSVRNSSQDRVFRDR